MNRIKKTLFLLFLFFPINFSLAATATFTGQIEDDGGDPYLYVWFQYGKTTAYGYETPRQTKYGPGEFTATVSGLENCTTYHYRAVARHQNYDDTSYGEDKTFNTPCPEISVDIKANGSDGPLTVVYNSNVILSWTSNNATSCSASGNWSGTKSISGTETISNITSSKIFTITCSGSGGSASDSVMVNIALPTSSVFSINKTVRNLSKGTGFLETVYADPNEVLIFAITIGAGTNPVYDVKVKDVLPSGLLYKGDLRINNVSVSGDILAGLNIGNLAANETKTITFKAEISGPQNFPFGQTELTNRVFVSSEENSLEDIAKVIVSKKAVAGAVTRISAGLTNNILLDSFILPLTLSLILVWLFKAKIIQFERWLDDRKRNFQEYKAQKLLKLKIAQIKAKNK